MLVLILNCTGIISYLTVKNDYPQALSRAPSNLEDSLVTSLTATPAIQAADLCGSN